MTKNQRSESIAIARESLVDQALVGKFRQIGGRASNGAHSRRMSAHWFHSALLYAGRRERFSGTGESRAQRPPGGAPTLPNLPRVTIRRVVRTRRSGGPEGDETWKGRGWGTGPAAS